MIETSGWVHPSGTGETVLNGRAGVRRCYHEKRVLMRRQLDAKGNVRQSESALNGVMEKKGGEVRQ